MTIDDAIIVLKWLHNNDYVSRFMIDEVKEATNIAINALEQEPKTGHWIKSNIPNEKYVCSECGGGCWYYDYQADVVKSRFCPKCGARMVDAKGEE